MGPWCRFGKTPAMKLLLVPTDFSPVADNALKYAMDMAMAMDASLMLVNVYQLPISFSEVPLVTISLDELKKISEDKLQELKQNIHNITSGKLKVYTESKLGEVAEEVKKLSAALHPFAVVMGTRGVTGVGNFFLGSNSMEVIEKAGVPVFVVPPGAQFRSFRKIGLTTDLRDVVETTETEPIKELVGFFNADLHVLNVDFESRHFTAATPEESLKLDTLLSGLNPVYDFIENKDVNEGISSFAEKNNMDLLITMPKKHSFIERLFEKSTTRDLIHQTHIPLLCIHKLRKSEMAGS